MKKIAQLLIVLTPALLFLLSCDERTQETDTGGVLLEVEFSSNDVPVIISVNDAVQNNGSLVLVGNIDINSVVADPNGNTSSLMDVELEAMEVTFRRADSGTRVPPAYVERLLSTIPVGGQLTLNDWPIMSVDQFRNPPLSDLLFENGGFDEETGDTIVRLDVIIRVFGRTLGDRRVESVPRPHTIEFRQ